MNQQQNRDDLIKRVLDQKRQTERREMTPKDVRAAEQLVTKKVMPRVYEK